MARLRELGNKKKGRPGWREVFDGFIVHKRLDDNIGELTEKDYVSHTNLLFKRFPDAWDTEETLKSAVMAHLSDNIKPATFNLRLVYLRAFFEYCVDEGVLSVNPLANTKKRKTTERAVSIEIEVLKALLAAPDQRTYVGLRDYTLILLTMDTGIRPAEALALIPQDFIPTLKEIRVPAEVAKSRVSRTLPLSDMTVKTLRKLISVRSDEWKPDVPIFCSYEGKMLNRHTWGDRMETYSKKVGVHIRPYDLRHVFALEFIRNGGNSFAVQKALGHSSMEMTRRYVSLVNNDLKAEHAKASPVNKLLAETKAKRNMRI